MLLTPVKCYKKKFQKRLKVCRFELKEKKNSRLSFLAGKEFAAKAVEVGQEYGKEAFEKTEKYAEQVYEAGKEKAEKLYKDAKHKMDL
jgi:vacuolar-type H+-ATPase subunit H